MEVANVEGKQADWITLPRMFSQDDLPVASDEIATPENIQQWKYLHRIIPEMKMDRIEVKTADWCKLPQSLGAPRSHFKSG